MNRPDVGVVTRMLNALDVGEPPFIHGDGSQSYDFIDVRDCALADIHATQSASTNNFYNVGTGVKTSVTRLAEMLSSLHVNKLHSVFKNVERPYVRNRIGCTEQAREELGFVAKISLDQGLRELIQSRNQQAETWSS